MIKVKKVDDHELFRPGVRTAIELCHPEIVDFFSPKACIVQAFILILLLASWQLSAQDRSIPERIKLYEQEIAEGKVDEIKMLRNYIDLITLYSPIDIEKTHHYFREAVAYAQEKKQLDWESAYWRRLSSVYYEMGKMDSSYYCIDRAIELVEGKGFDYEQCANYQVLGVALYMGHEYEKSLNAYLKALELNEKDKAQKIAANENVHNNLGIEASTYRYISRIYSKILNYDKAIEYLLRAKKIMDDNPTDRAAYILFEIELHSELAEEYMTTGQPEKALPLLTRAYEMAVARDFFPEMVFGLCRLSNFYCVERNDFSQALTFGKEALQIAEKTEMPYLISYAERNLMKVFFGLKDYQSACNYAERALSKADEADWDHLQDIYGNLIIIYTMLGNVDRAEAYLKKYNGMTAKISDKNLHNSLQEMEVKYSVQEKELEITRKQAEIDRQKTRQLIYIGIIISAALLLALLAYAVMLRTRRNRVLAEMNAIKDKFFSIISHDLKNPAIAQRDSLQLLAENADRLDAGTVTAYYRQLLKSANGLVDLLKNLLNWAQIQTGRNVYRPFPFDLVSALQSDIEMAKSMAARKDVVFEATTPPAAIINADENMIVTVVRNLLANAVKFTAKGGQVTLDISPAGRDAMHCVSTTYIVSVTDTGAGMTPDQIQNLFRIDRQQSREGTAGEKGTGLGLIVCKEFIEKHGSTLHVASEAGKGSRFWFEGYRG